MLYARRRPTRSIYALTREEIARGLANRFVHSRTYIFLYLGMAALSVTTVVLSLTDGCPGLAFYILEIIINTAMIIEVGIRFVALGRVRSYLYPFEQFPTFRTAILEVAIQHHGCNPHCFLCADATGVGFCRLRRREQGRGGI
jgi:hypothetical protein